MKSTVFIGSSSESLKLAQVVKIGFQKYFETRIWTDTDFPSNDSPLETILMFSGMFDFGIFIASKDDLLRSRGAQFAVARDNVLFEYGIFLGALGKKNSFLLLEEGIELPSDLKGINVVKYNLEAEEVSHNSFLNAIDKVLNEVRRYDEYNFYRLLPSTTIAISYFENFLERLSDVIGYEDMLSVEGVTYTPVKIRIVLPDNLRGDIQKKVAGMERKLKLVKGNVAGVDNGRFMSLSVKIDSTTKSATIYDLPTSLSGIDNVIKAIYNEKTATPTATQKLIERKELYNFEKVLAAKLKDLSFEVDVDILYEKDLLKNRS